MKIIDREMRSTVTTTEKSQTSLYCQASINSDGVITLRNYDVRRKDSDEIIVLSREETEAIIKLFGEIKRLDPQLLPF